jgi:hypothetical protein
MKKRCVPSPLLFVLFESPNLILILSFRGSSATADASARRGFAVRQSHGWRLSLHHALSLSAKGMSNLVPSDFVADLAPPAPPGLQLEKTSGGVLDIPNYSLGQQCLLKPAGSFVAVQVGLN